MHAHPPPTPYRFGGFTLDPAERRLEGPRGEVHLRPRTLDLLLHLVEHEGHLVTRQTLLDAVWADAEVTENGLSQCVRELRAALGDDPKEPRFIQTVQRGGYRFIAATTRVPAAPYHEEVSAVTLVVAETEERVATIPASKATAPNRIPAWRWLLAAATLAGSVLAGLWLARPTGLVLTTGDWILVGDLDGPGSEPGVGPALRTQLERELRLSRLASVVPRGRVADTLALMKRPADTRLTEPVAREVCLRDGAIRALLTGAVHSVGGRFSIDVTVVEPVTGNAVAAFSREAANRQELLPAARRLAMDVRRELGEALAAGTRQPAPALERATTPSLEALTLYSKGQALMDAFEWGRAHALFDQAVAADPGFALGHFFRGVARSMRGSDARLDFERALALAGGVTAREQAMIHAIATSSTDSGAALDSMEAFLARYPDEYWGHEIVSWQYYAAGNHAKWREHQAACRRLRPNFAQPWFHDGWVRLVAEGDVEGARTQFARVLALNPRFSSVSVQCAAAHAAWMQGKMDEAAARFEDFLAHRVAWLTASAQLTARAYLARFYAFNGMPGEALALLETGRGLDFSRPDADVAAHFRFERAFVYEQLGREGESSRLLRATAAATVGVERLEALGWLGIRLARRGLSGQALALRDEILRESRMPVVDFWHPRRPLDLEHARRAFALQIEGDLLLARYQPEAALDRFAQILEIASPRGALFATELSARPWLAATQSVGRAHERLGRWEAAASAYRRIVERKALCIGTDGASGTWIAALGSLAKALERAGKENEATAWRAELESLRPARPAER